MRLTQEITFPTERELAAGFDAWELLPSLDFARLHGRHVRVSLEILPDATPNTNALQARRVGLPSELPWQCVDSTIVKEVPKGGRKPRDVQKVSCRACGKPVKPLDHGPTFQSRRYAHADDSPAAACERLLMLALDEYHYIHTCPPQERLSTMREALWREKWAVRDLVDRVAQVEGLPQEEASMVVLHREASNMTRTMADPVLRASYERWCLAEDLANLLLDTIAHAPSPAQSAGRIVITLAQGGGLAKVYDAQTHKEADHVLLDWADVAEGDRLDDEDLDALDSDDLREYLGLVRGERQASRIEAVLAARAPPSA